MMSKIDKEKFDPIIEPASDKSHRLVRAAIGALPMLSGTALEALNSIIEDPYQARRTAWLHELSNAVNALGDNLETLREDSQRSNAILSAILQSTDIALKTSDTKIHHYLIEVVLKVAQEGDPDEEVLTLYLSTIRQLTSSHLELLNLIFTRKRYEKGSEGERKEVEFMAEIESHSGISNAIPPERLLNDLFSLQLIFRPPGAPWSSSGTYYCSMAPSDFAIQFMKYLSKI